MLILRHDFLNILVYYLRRHSLSEQKFLLFKLSICFGF